MKVESKILFTLAIVILLVAFVLTATTFNSQARMMPLFIGVPVLLVAIWQLGLEFFDSRKKKEDQPTESIETAPVPGPGRVRSLQVYVWTLVMFAAIYLLGFVVTTLAYPLLYMRFVGHRSWRLSAGVSLGALAFLYIAMIWALNVDLYDGVVFLAIRQATQGY